MIWCKNKNSFSEDFLNLIRIKYLLNVLTRQVAAQDLHPHTDAGRWPPFWKDPDELSHYFIESSHLWSVIMTVPLEDLHRWSQRLVNQRFNWCSKQRNDIFFSANFPDEVFQLIEDPVTVVVVLDSPLVWKIVLWHLPFHSSIFLFFFFFFKSSDDFPKSPFPKMTDMKEPYFSSRSEVGHSVALLAGFKSES